ncbi:hypothetical protein BGX31_002158, partial [Mortierella sp. GBA43]
QRVQGQVSPISTSGPKGSAKAESTRAHSVKSASVKSFSGTLQTTESEIVPDPLSAPFLHENSSDSCSIISRTPDDTGPPTKEFKAPGTYEPLEDTPQLVYCLRLLQTSQKIDDIEGAATRDWLRSVKMNLGEQGRLKRLAKDVIGEFTRDDVKDAAAVAEVVLLAPVLEKADLRSLLNQFYLRIGQPGLLEFHQIEGLARVIQSTPKKCISDDLDKTIKLLSDRLRNTHDQSVDSIFKLTQAVSNVLDAMVNVEVQIKDSEALQKPLSSYLERLRKSGNPYMSFQAAYACQALKHVPDNTSLWQEALKRTGKVIQGVAGVAIAVNSFDIEKFITGLGKSRKRFQKLSLPLKTRTMGSWSCTRAAKT